MVRRRSLLRRAALGWLVGVLAALCLGDLNTVPAGPRSARAEAPPAAHGPSSFVWRATVPGKPGQVLLVGSVHMRSAEDARLDRAVSDAVVENDRVAFEIDFAQDDETAMLEFAQAHGVIPDGRTLEDVLPPPTYAVFRKAVEGAGVQPEIFAPMQPWLAALTLQTVLLDQAGIRAEDGIDQRLDTLARQESSRKRTIVGLETAREQLEMFSSLSADAQAAMVRETAEADFMAEMQLILRMYSDGDAAGIERYLDKERRENPEYEPFFVEMLDVRNKKMAAKLVEEFETPGTMVATVGAAHVFGELGLIALLEKAGATVSAVPRAGPAPAEVMALTVSKPEIFASEGDGFSADFGRKPVVQSSEAPLPDGSGNMKANVYMAPLGAAGVLMVTVHNFPKPVQAPGVSPEAVRTALSGTANAMLAPMGMIAGEAKETTLAGAPAYAMEATGSAGSGRVVALARGRQLVVVLGAAMSQDPTQQKRVQEGVQRLLDTFAWSEPGA